MKNFGMVLLALLSAVYLINPSAGLFELLPDNLPFIGNLDEAAAAALLIACLRYFGIDLTRAFSRKKVKEVNPRKNSKPENRSES